MVAPDGEPISTAAAERLLDDIGTGLSDSRYLCIEGRRLLVVREVARLVNPRATAARWRATAASRGLGDLHLCAVESTFADSPEDIGFDSFLQAPESAGDHAEMVARALARPWPAHRFFRSVECRRDTVDMHAGEFYEHWLRSAFDATRRRGESLVFVDSWNDWLRGRYLEPDDRDGHAALLATRRATRGPASGLVLLRQLRDALGEVGGAAAVVLEELEQVLALHEHTRDRLLASVEAALGRSHAMRREALRWAPVKSWHLPPSSGRFALDRVGTNRGAELHGRQEPIPLNGDEVHLQGWAHTETCTPLEVDLFLALESLESSAGTGDRIFPIPQRVARPDLVAAFPGYPPNCGFDTVVKLVDLPPGTYGIVILQRTPDATYRDATGVTVKRDGAPCSSV
jgi:hypothetical protein